MRLQDFLRDDDFLRAIAVRLGRQRDANRVADAFLQQHRHAGGRGDDALRAHAGFGEAEMQRVVAARREIAIDGDQILHAADLARDDDAIVRPSPSSSARSADSSAETTSASRMTSFASSGCARLRVLVHQARQQILIEAAPVHADAHRLGVAAGDFDHFGELRIALAAATDVAGIDAVLRQRLGAGRMRLEQAVAVEMKVADDAARTRPRARADRECAALRPRLRRC